MMPQDALEIWMCGRSPPTLVPMSAVGTKRTCKARQWMSAFRVGADMNDVVIF